MLSLQAVVNRLLFVSLNLGMVVSYSFCSYEKLKFILVKQWILIFNECCFIVHTYDFLFMEVLGLFR